MSFSVVARNNDIFKKLVLEAKRDYEKHNVHRVNIFTADKFVSSFMGLDGHLRFPLLVGLPVGSQTVLARNVQ